MYFVKIIVVFLCFSLKTAELYECISYKNILVLFFHWKKKEFAKHTSINSILKKQIYNSWLIWIFLTEIGIKDRRV